MGCTGHDFVLAPGSPAARKRKPRRLREEGAVGVAIMISDTRGLWHADMIRSAAARPRGAKSSTGVLGLVLTKWRLASTDAGRNEALGLHELERRRLQAGTLSGFVEYLCLATAVLLSPVHHGIMDPCALLKILEPFEVELPPVEDGARSSIHPSTQVNKDVKIRINNWKDGKNMTMLLIGRQDGSGIMSSRETCRIHCLRRLHMAEFRLATLEFLAVAFFKI